MWRQILQLLLLPEDAARKTQGLKTSPSSMQLPLKLCQTDLESDAVFSISCYENDNYITDQILHTFCLSKTLLTPSCGWLSLHHAADNKLVKPTHCISPHHPHCYLLLLPSGLRFYHGASGGEERLGGLRGRRRG